MRVHSRIGRLIGSAVFVLTLAAAVPASWASGAAGLATGKLIECQRPVRTGEEAYQLVGVSTKTACAVVRDLGHWEYQPGHVVEHIKALYRCVGVGKSSPGRAVLKLHTFEGWTLSQTSSGAFRMSRGSSSFLVTGTDFPLNCT